jgi:hypothetical protein
VRCVTIEIQGNGARCFFYMVIKCVFSSPARRTGLPKRAPLLGARAGEPKTLFITVRLVARMIDNRQEWLADLSAAPWAFFRGEADGRGASRSHRRAPLVIDFVILIS